MSANTDRWDRQLNTGVAMMNSLPESERDEFARQFRVRMGFESRFRSYKPGWRAKLWNWIIDAERTRW